MHLLCLCCRQLACSPCQHRTYLLTFITFSLTKSSLYSFLKFSFFLSPLHLPGDFFFLYVTFPSTRHFFSFLYCPSISSCLPASFPSLPPCFLCQLCVITWANSGSFLLSCYWRETRETTAWMDNQDRWSHMEKRDKKAKLIFTIVFPSRLTKTSGCQCLFSTF